MKITAIAERSGGWWAIRVPEIPGVFSQARRLEQVADMAADAAALMLDQDPADFEVTVEAHTPEDSLIAQARAAREDADRAAELASAKMREAARCLIADEYTVRDAGRLLGVSPQRVSQLVDA
jgi:predicted RNase H-like HicB family nuclease